MKLLDLINNRRDVAVGVIIGVMIGAIGCIVFSLMLLSGDANVGEKGLTIVCAAAGVVLVVGLVILILLGPSKPKSSRKGYEVRSEKRYIR